jgi:circadian clock protein KaiC
MASARTSAAPEHQSAQPADNPQIKSSPSSQTNDSAPFSVPRISTGTPGLDDILGGGLPTGRMYLLEGEPGSGKTTLALKVLLHGVAQGERVLYITMSETEDELRSSARTHGWDLEGVRILELTPDEANAETSTEYTVFYPSEVELSTTIRNLLQEVEQHKPSIIVMDSLSELRLLAKDPVRYRRQLLALKQFFSDRRSTVLILDDRSDNDDVQLRTIVHGVIHLSKMPRDYGVTRRHLEVIKLRGSTFREGFHDYIIETGGIQVFPRLIAGEHDCNFPDDAVLSGLPELDDLLGGGIQRGTSTLVTGPSGIGKTSLVMQYLVHQAMQGERCVYFTFDEIGRLICKRSAGLGIPANEAIDSGNFIIDQIDPAELSPGEFIHRIRQRVESGVRFLAIDSINGLLNSMPGEHELILQLHELLAYLNQKGVVTFMILTTAGLVGQQEIAIDVSYLSDNILMLRYFEALGEVRQALSAVKKRTGNHERSIRELRFENSRLSIGPPIRDFHGVLSGLPRLADGEYRDNNSSRSQNGIAHPTDAKSQN